MAESIITCAVNQSAQAAADGESLSRHRWTLKRLVHWCKERWGIVCSRETVRRVLKRRNLSWKKAKKLLNRADPKKRQKYLDALQPLLNQATRQEKLLIYIDEAHIHQDTDQGYGWSEKGKRFWVSSDSPGLSAKVTFYGLYYFNEGQVKIWPYPKGNKEHTVNVLERIRLENPNRDIGIIWDGASYHKAIVVQEAAKRLNLELIPLPAYSPDFMPVEALWRWLREDLTYHYCYGSKDELAGAVNQFCQEINQDPIAVADRLWVVSSLDEEVEKLRKTPLSKPRQSKG